MKVDNERYLDTRETARAVGVSERTVEGWRLRGTGPLYIRSGHRVLYALSEIQRWKDIGSQNARAEMEARAARHVERVSA